MLNGMMAVSSVKLYTSILDTKVYFIRRHEVLVSTIILIGVSCCLVTWYFLMDQSSSCKDPLGLQTGFLETRDIKTSSSLSNFSATDPWCATKVDDKQYIAFDLGEDFSLSKVAIQGKIDDKNRFIESFTMDYSSDAKKWSEYKDIFGKSDLDGNKNTYDVQAHDLVPAIVARYVKLKPKKWNNGICATVDMFGCAIDDLKGGKVANLKRRKR